MILITLSSGTITTWVKRNYAFENLNDNHAGAKAGCDVNAAEAWKTCTGDPSIIVAVLDEGVMYTHPDPAANMWCNPYGDYSGSQD